MNAGITDLKPGTAESPALGNSSTGDGGVLIRSIINTHDQMSEDEREAGPYIIRAPNRIDAAGVHYGRNVQKAEVIYDDGDWIHRCEGNRMVDNEPGTFLVWTLCNKDVPAGKGYVNSRERVTCRNCIARLAALSGGV